MLLWPDSALSLSLVLQAEKWPGNRIKWVISGGLTLVASLTQPQKLSNKLTPSNEIPLPPFSF